MANSPELWDKLLNDWGRDCYVAGGAIRDWYLAMPEKDIDVFVPWSGEPRLAIEGRGYELQPPRIDRANEYVGMTNIALIDDYQLTVDEDIHNIQLIYLNVASIREYIQNDVDLNLSRCFYNGGLVLGRTFMGGVISRQIVVQTPRNPRSTERATNLQNKLLREKQQTWRIING